LSQERVLLFFNRKIKPKKLKIKRLLDHTVLLNVELIFLMREPKSIKIVSPMAEFFIIRERFVVITK
jgi:hypothetical protein